MLMLVLGVSDVEHDTAAVLLDGDQPVVAIEEDKLCRASETRGVPREAILRCLAEAGAQMTDLSAAAVASRPRRAWLRKAGGRFAAFISSLQPSSHQMEGQDGFFWKLGQFGILRKMVGPQIGPINFEHHLCHAASAFYPSGFDRALVLTLDRCGDMWSGLLALGEGTELKTLQPLPFPNSLGWFYSQVTGLLGFRPGRDEHKVQWLSKQGTPEFVSVFRKLFSKNSHGLPALEPRYLGKDQMGRSVLSAEARRQLQVSEAAALQDRSLSAAIARSAQDFLEETVIELAEEYRKRTGATYLCVAGGVFLNALLVRALERKTGFAKVFVQPVSGNAGTALGAAYLARKHLSKGMKREHLSHLYLGPKCEEDQIKTVLENSKTIFRYLPDEKQLVEETVQLLVNSNIVAWYQGRLEFGHRALGNRSILASPFAPYVTENLNHYVKHRENFHPFAISIPAEKAAELFDCTDNCRFMSSVATLKKANDHFDQFTFNGRAVRLHAVQKQVNPRFWNLLSKFGETAPAPVLVNTSFNLFGEPLVCEPRDALRSFYCSAIDALVLGDFMILKR